MQDNGRIAFAFFPAYLHVLGIQQLFCYQLATRIRTASDVLARPSLLAKMQNVLRAFGCETKTARVQDNARIAFAFFPMDLHVWDIQQLLRRLACWRWVAGWLVAWLMLAGQPVGTLAGERVAGWRRG